MRKFLWVVAVGALVLAVAAPVLAVDVKFGAEYRVRFYDYANLGFTSVQGTNPRGVQLRIRPRFDASDDNGNITATWRAEFGDTEFGGGGGANGQGLGVLSNGTNQSQSSLPSTQYKVVGLGNRVGNGAGGGAGNDGVALETKWAYMDFALPFGVPLRVRAGIQPWYMPKGLVTDDDYAGVRAYGSVAPVSYEIGWWRANRGSTTTALAGNAAGAQGFSVTKDNSLDYYHVKFDVAIAKAINPYIYYVYGDNRSNCTGNTSGTFTDIPAACAVNDRVRPQHFVGLGFTGTAGIVSYDLDWLYGRAKGGIQGNMYSTGPNGDGQAVNVNGWMLDGGVHAPIGPVTLHLVGSYATGDKQKTSGHSSSAFPGGPGTSWSGPSRPYGGPYELIGEGGDYDVISLNHTPTNLWTVGLAADYLPVKALTLRVAWLYAGFVNKNGNCAVAVAGSIGCFGPVWEGGNFTTAGAPAGSLAGTGTGGVAGKSSLGNEIDLKAYYRVWTGFQIMGMAGWLIPSSGSTTGKYILQFLYNF